jgi:hypothetical protein
MGCGEPQKIVRNTTTYGKEMIESLFCQIQLLGKSHKPEATSNWIIT